MGGILGIGVGMLVLGLIVLVFFPWGGVVLLAVGLIIVVAFLLGFGRRAAGPPA